jgi:hypothetical protein
MVTLTATVKHVMTGIWAAQPEDGRFAIVTKTVYVLITRM